MFLDLSVHRNMDALKLILRKFWTIHFHHLIHLFFLLVFQLSQVNYGQFIRLLIS